MYQLFNTIKQGKGYAEIILLDMEVFATLTKQSLPSSSTLTVKCF